MISTNDPYARAQLTRFRNQVGPERLTDIMNSLIRELVESGIIKGETLALDATFIKAWSRRDPEDDSPGYSDPESRVGRDGKTYDLGYKAHLAVDVDSDMPVAVVVASANDNQGRNTRRSSLRRLRGWLMGSGLWWLIVSTAA